MDKCDPPCQELKSLIHKVDTISDRFAVIAASSEERVSSVEMSFNRRLDAFEVSLDRRLQRIEGEIGVKVDRLDLSMAETKSVSLATHHIITIWRDEMQRQIDVVKDEAALMKVDAAVSADHKGLAVKILLPLGYAIAGAISAYFGLPVP
jgi:hypothetical protein